MAVIELAPPACDRFRPPEAGRGNSMAPSYCRQRLWLAEFPIICILTVVDLEQISDLMLAHSEGHDRD